MRPTLQTVPESLPADHVTQAAQTAQTAVAAATPAQAAIGVTAEKIHPTTTPSQSTTPSVSLKPRSSSSRVSETAKQCLTVPS